MAKKPTEEAVKTYVVIKANCDRGAKGEEVQLTDQQAKNLSGKIELKASLFTFK